MPEEDKKENLPQLTKQQKEQYILEKLEHVEKDVKNLDNFAAGQFLNVVKNLGRPIDREKDKEFATYMNGTIEAKKANKIKLVEKML